MLTRTQAEPGGAIYFPDGSVNSVLGAINNITGKDTNPGNQNGDPPQEDEPRSSKLSSITVTADFADEKGKFACTGQETVGATPGESSHDSLQIWFGPRRDQ